MWRASPWPILVLALLACEGGQQDSQPLVSGPAPQVTSPAPSLRRLTTSQYTNSVQDLLGDELVMPSALQPDVELDELLSLGAATDAVTGLGSERYESAAYMLAAQVVDDADRFDALVPCAPSSAADADCAEQLVQEFGRRAWRRPLSDAETARLVNVITSVGAEEGEFTEGVRYGLAAVLQSPYFVYRVENGQPAEGGQRLLDDWELATRLAYLLWNSTPDDVLLDAAAAGELSTEEGLRDQALRLLEDPRAAEGVRNLFDELFGLYELEGLSKDPTVFTHAGADLNASAREETLRVIEDLVLVQRADFRDLFTTQSTFIDPRLAALYNVPAPDMGGFGPAWLEREQGRRGLFGQASFLMLNAHSTRSSATLRGAFVRKVLLCQSAPPPPADVDTSIPEADATSPTLRERIQTHFEEPTCARCHLSTDPIGLGMENFDGIGRWRDTENDAVIDASGVLDGELFYDAWELGQTVSEHERLSACLTTHLYQYAVGHPLGDGEQELRDWLTLELEINGYDWQELLLAVATSPGFRQVGELQ